MPGLISPSSAASVGAVAGMKRAYAAESVPTYGEPHPKKRKVVHKLHHTQPIQQIVEPVSAEIDPTGESKDFFDHQLLRAIALECKGVGFDGARPEVLEQFRALVDSYMMNLLGDVRKSMTSARRTEPVPHDWVYALARDGFTGSSSLEQHLDTGEVPPSLLQPTLFSSVPEHDPVAEIDEIIGPDLSGRPDKESRTYIPKHFPPFPPKHTYVATPVFTQRETDPRKIREKATDEGIEAEKSLRKLMAKQKEGLQKQKAGKRKRSQRMKESDKLWQEAMEDVLKDEAEADEKARLRQEDEDEWEGVALQPRSERKVNLEEGVHVNYDRKFWRKSARGV